MQDFLGQKLEVGDTVVYIRPQYRELEKGKIMRMTKFYVFIKRLFAPDGTYNPDELKQYPAQLVKING